MRLLRVFAKNGYQHASTNEIVKEAGISKGLLFHYFKSKKDLYLSLHQHLTDMFLEKIYEQIDWNERDIFMMIRQVTLLKFDLFKKYPDILNFLRSVYTDESKEIINEINHRKEELMENSFEKLFANIDINKFKDVIDVGKAIEIIYWSLEGFANKMQAKVKTVSVDEIDVEETLAEMDAYIELLKASFYK